MSRIHTVTVLVVVALVGGCGGSDSDTLDAEAATEWCESHLGSVLSASGRDSEYFSVLLAEDRVPDEPESDVPGEVRSLVDSDDLPRAAERWQELDAEGWASSCEVAFAAEGDLSEANWVWCRQNSYEVADAARTLGMLSLIPEPGRAHIQDNLSNTDLGDTAVNLGRLNLYLDLRTHHQSEWARACAVAFESR